MKKWYQKMSKIFPCGIEKNYFSILKGNIFDIFRKFWFLTDMNTWNHISVDKLLVFVRNIWYYTTVCEKLLKKEQ